MPSNSSVGSYVDVNLDNSRDGAQKYVTFDEDESTGQPFGNSTLRLEGQHQQEHSPQRQVPHQGGVNGTSNTSQCIAIETPKFDQLKKWTVSNYKYTKQLVSERFGHSTKTVDKELEDQINELRLSKIQYANLLKEARAMHARYGALLSCHRNLRSQFQTLISHQPDLQDQLQANATTQSVLERNGECLLGAIKMFVDSLNTLVTVTYQDTFLTIKNYEAARIDYDAYRNELTVLQNAIVQSDTIKNRQLETQVIFEERKQRWQKLKSDTSTKIKLLHENKLAVMKAQLDMFNNAVVAYFSGNGDKLNEILSEYHIKIQRKSEDDVTTKSFLASQN